MPDIDTAALITRVEAAMEGVTEGPWVAEFSGEQGDCVIPHDAQSTREAVCVTRLYNKVADAEFIAWCRSGVPELVSALKAAQETVGYQHGIITQYEDRLEAAQAETERLRGLISRVADDYGLVGLREEAGL